MCRLNLMENNEKEIPSVSIYVTQSGGYLVATATYKDYINRRNYLTVIEHGIIYIRKTTLGTEELTVDTPNVEKVAFGKYSDEGKFLKKYKPSGSKVYYCFKAYLKYRTKNGDTGYVYSGMMTKNVRGF